MTPREFELAGLIQVAQRARSRDQSPASALLPPQELISGSKGAAEQYLGRSRSGD